MRGWIFLPALALLLAETAQAGAAIPPCRANPDRVGSCRTVHGRFFFANGTPSKRIWVVGTRRILGVSERPAAGGEGVEGLPANLQAALPDQPFRTEVYGDFEVCPFTRERPGWMQIVCIARAARLHVVRREG
ncbi:MAG: hypothetical protein E6G92_03015 [Alphaproteobacteria bacterium]|nr:MAG: hypothetical protein E6G92_03015 [Alphaproteobacteria bacterium]